MDNAKLTDLRSQVDQIDSEILNILNKRFKVAREIGKVKKESNLPALDEKRWSEVLKNKIELGMTYGLGVDFILDVYNAIHREALRQQEEIIK
jgi:chorismate mutase